MRRATCASCHHTGRRSPTAATTSAVYCAAIGGLELIDEVGEVGPLELARSRQHVGGERDRLVVEHAGDREHVELRDSAASMRRSIRQRDHRVAADDHQRARRCLFRSRRPTPRTASRPSGLVARGGSRDPVSASPFERTGARWSNASRSPGLNQSPPGRSSDPVIACNDHNSHSATLPCGAMVTPVPVWPAKRP